MGLVFGNGNVLTALSVLLLLAALAAYLLLGDPRTAAKLPAALESKEAPRVAALLVPAVAISGVFGGSAGMCLVPGLAALALLLVAFQGPAGRIEVPDLAAALPPQDAPHPLPAGTDAEVLPSLDVRHLCRGLPSALAGEVLVTAEDLEAGGRGGGAPGGGHARRAFDAGQSLRHHLPETGSGPGRRSPRESATLPNWKPNWSAPWSRCARFPA
ncbi:hypothetical protein [Deinococcus hopiensis]|uniref:hypothetical protein n=1 Tax=Deinococcus hopiensis TaxID=309885 RepID=UPI00111C6259|nr:hypothetical protein [Deinococcus hopiensis]